MDRFIDDLVNFCIKNKIDFYSLSYLQQKKVIRHMLKDICKHFSNTCKDFKVVFYG